MTDNLLEIRGLETYYGKIQALRGIDLDIRQGEIATIIGANGAGKTTMLRAITGVVQPQLGSVYLEEREITRHPTHARVRLGLGLSQQLVRPFRQMSVVENVMFTAGSQKTKAPRLYSAAALPKTNRSAATANIL